MRARRLGADETDVGCPTFHKGASFFEQIRAPVGSLHAVTVNIRGNSYRLKDKLKSGLVRAQEPSDIT